MDLLSSLKKKRVISSVRNLDQINIALEKKAEIIFLVAGNIFDLMKIRLSKKCENVLLFVHLDLLKGIARDEAGIFFLKHSFGMDGIISTHANVIQIAKKEGISTIQRLFILDSSSLESAAKLVNACKPDGVEILPGVILPHIEEELKMYTFPPIIAGGLIKTENDVKNVLNSGAIAVSTSNEDLW
jgi:glycerol uptake operon antiterminator